MRIANRLSAVVFILSVGAATGQETIDNPEFATWSKFQKGTSTTMKTTSTVGGMTSEATVTTTLLEVGTDKVVVETQVVSNMGGKEFKPPPMKRDVTKKIALPKGAEKPKDGGVKPPGTYEEGTETLKVSGMEIKTKWYKFKTEQAGIKGEGKMWTSDDAPGYVVKMEMKSTGAFSGDSKMDLIEIKKP